MKQNNLIEKIGIKNYQEFVESIASYFNVNVYKTLSSATILTFDSDDEYDSLIEMYGEDLTCIVANVEVSNDKYSSLVGGLELESSYDNLAVSVKATDSIILFPESNFDDEKTKCLLMSQLLQLLKSINKKTTIRYNNVVARNGISETLYNIVEDEDGYYDLEFVGVEGLGLESAFNAIQVEDLMCDYLHVNEDAIPYKYYKDYIKELYYHETFNRELIKAQITGNKKGLIEHFDRVTYRGAYESLEMFWDQFFFEFNYSETLEDTKKALKNLDQGYIDFLEPLYESYREGVCRSAGNSRSRNS